MTISPTAAADAAGTAAKSSLLGGADFNMFLKLLTTQMQNQDPLDPMDTSQYTQQLVQYSQVEQSVQQTGVLKDILARLSVQDMSQTSGLIGREVEVASPVAGLGTEGSARWAWTAGRTVGTVTAEIVDASGRTVATPTLGGGTSGTLSWDGMLASGGRAPAGRYTLRLTGADASGTSVPMEVRSVGRVDTVTRVDNTLAVGIAGVTYPADKVVRVSAAS